MAKATRRRVAAVGEASVLEDLSFAWLPNEVWSKAIRSALSDARAMRNQLRRCVGGPELLDLFERAHLRVRNAPLLALLPPQIYVEAGARIFDRADALHSARGEHRLRLLLGVAAEVSESLYQHYVRALWVLDRVSRGEPFKQPPDYGAMVNELRGRIQNALLVADCAHLRNAGSHWGGAQYDALNHTLQLRDRSPWRREMTAREMDLEIRRMLGAAATTYRIAQEAFVLEAMGAPRAPSLPKFCRQLSSNDPRQLELAVRTADAWKDELTGELKRYLESSARKAMPTSANVSAKST